MRRPSWAPLAHACPPARAAAKASGSTARESASGLLRSSSRPGQQVREAERLGEVAVGPGFEGCPDVAGVIPRGEHQDGHGLARAAQFARDLDPGSPGEHVVQQDQVVPGGEGLRQGRGTVLGQVHLEALLGEALLEETGDLLVIFHDEEPHRGKVMRPG